MTMRATSLILASLILAIAAPATAQNIKTDSLVYRMVNFSKEFGTPDDSLWCCAHFKASYPLIITGADKATTETINNFYDQVMVTIGYNAEANSWEERANHILSIRTDLLSAPSSIATIVGTDITTEVLLNGYGLFATRTRKVSFFGGRPIAANTFANFDITTGSQLTLLDLIDDTNLSELQKAGDQVLRGMFKIPAETSLNSKDFTFAEDKFSLPSGFLITPTGLEFYFARDEVSPREIRLTIPWAEIAGLLKPDSPLKGIEWVVTALSNPTTD